MNKNIKILLFGLLGGVIVTAFAANVEPKKDPSAITLVSPNGKNKIIFSAQDDGVGIWLSKGGVKQLVSIYNGFKQGAVVGVYRDPETDQTLSACLYASDKETAGLQLVDSKKKVHHLNGDRLGKLK